MSESGDRKKKIILGTLALVIVASLIFSESLRKMVSRNHQIHDAERELQRLSVETDRAREKISHLKASPGQYENLVRTELGYIRPGEKEVRFGKNEK